ncbi:PAS domain-containing protein, partial [Halorubrum sp. SP3]
RREREYEQIFNGVNDAIAIFDPETTSFVDVNDSYHELVGCDDLDRIRELGIQGLSATEDGYTAEHGTEL